VPDLANTGSWISAEKGSEDDARFSVIQVCSLLTAQYSSDSDIAWLKLADRTTENESFGPKLSEPAVAVVENVMDEMSGTRVTDMG
jgi:hypothetical protein